jgi:hypothetical protein
MIKGGVLDKKSLHSLSRMLSQEDHTTYHWVSTIGNSESHLPLHNSEGGVKRGSQLDSLMLRLWESSYMWPTLLRSDGTESLVR